MTTLFSCRNCGEQLPLTGDAFCTFCHEPIEIEPADVSQPKEHVDQVRPLKSSSIRSPHHAWLAPIFGIGASVLIMAFTSQTREASGSKVVEMLPGLVFIVFLLFGLFKSVQCLFGFRRVGHGIAGLLINGVGLMLVALMIFVAISAIQNQNSPETLVRIEAIQIKKNTPLQIDETTTLVSVFVDPPTTLNFICTVHNVPFELFDTEAINKLETNTRKNVPNSRLGNLLTNGADIRYVYQHEEGKVLCEFTISGTAR